MAVAKEKRDPMAKQKPRGRPFQKGGPGGPGRKPGVPNKATQDIKDLARLLVEDDDYLTALRARLIAGEAGPVENLLFHYAYGKPKELIELNTKEPISVIFGGRFKPDA